MFKNWNTTKCHSKTTHLQQPTHIILTFWQNHLLLLLTDFPSIHIYIPSIGCNALPTTSTHLPNYLNWLHGILLETKNILQTRTYKNAITTGQCLSNPIVLSYCQQMIPSPYSDFTKTHQCYWWNGSTPDDGLDTTSEHWNVSILHDDMECSESHCTVTWQILCVLFISTIYCDEINHDVLDVPDVLDVLGVLDGTELLPTNDPKSLQPLY